MMQGLGPTDYFYHPPDEWDEMITSAAMRVKEAMKDNMLYLLPLAGTRDGALPGKEIKPEKERLVEYLAMDLAQWEARANPMSGSPLHVQAMLIDFMKLRDKYIGG